MSENNTTILINNDIEKKIFGTSFLNIKGLYRFLKKFVDSYDCVGNGIKHEEGWSELYFHVNPTEMEDLKLELLKEMKREGLEEMVIVEFYNNK